MKHPIYRYLLAFVLLLLASPSLAKEPVEGVNIKLSVGDRVVATQTTGENGMVTFTGLKPGETYAVSVDLDELTKLMKAKEKANRTKCSNNLRLIGGQTRWNTDPYVETSQRLQANDNGEITLQLTGECKKP
jgi:hypothetical protein